MPELNQKIQKYIKRSRVSVYQLAKNSNLDRTMIQKMLKGTKYPGVKFFYKFCDALMLNRDEREELIRLFRIEKEGFSHYQTHVEINRLLELLQSGANDFDCRKIASVSASVLPARDGQSVEINGAENIRLFIYMMLKEQISEQSAQHIYMDVCRWSDQILQILYRFKSMSKRNVEIHQHAMLSYQSNISESNLENIYTMQKILPALFLLGEHYHIRYVYVNNAREGYMYLPYQHYLLGEDRLFLFNEAGTRGINITDRVLIESFRKEVCDIEEKSLPMVRFSNTPEETAKICRDVISNNRLVASYSISPAISMFLVPLFCDESVDEGVREILRRMGEKQLSAMEERDYIQIHGSAGIYRFLETGTMSPAGLYFPAVPEEERIPLVREYVDLLENTGNTYLLKKNDPVSNVLSGCKIQLFAPNRILLSQSGSSVPHGMALLEENSLYENLMDYFRSLIEYEEVYDPKESAEQFRKIIDNFISKV